MNKEDYERFKEIIETKIKKLKNPLETYQKLIKIGEDNLPREESIIAGILDDAKFLSKNFTYKDWTYEEIQKSFKIFIDGYLKAENGSKYRGGSMAIDDYHHIGIDNLSDKQYNAYVEYCKMLNYHITPRG